MTGERVLDVYMDGWSEPVGRLIAFSDQSTSFQYAEAYLASGQGLPLSLSLPFMPTPFDDVSARAFFANLLPENDQIQQLMDQHGIARSDFVALLEHLGADCPGALSCVPLGAGPVKAPGVMATDYDPIDDQVIGDLVGRMARCEPLPDEVRDPSPIAGVQRKIALTRLPGGALALPRPGTGAPTTHILKTPRAAEAREAGLEAVSARMARAVGLNVAVPEVVEFGGYSSVLIERYDRRVEDGVIFRVHQEDFAQALGLPASLKYERYGRAPRVFDLGAIAWVLEQTAVPILAKQEFIKLTLFNICIGNADNHAKNHSLLYLGAIPVLSPAYDLVPTRLNPNLTAEMGFRLGSASSLEHIDANAVAALFRALGFSAKAASRFAQDQLATLFLALDAAANDAPKDFDDMIGANLEIVSSACGLELPVRERDDHEPVGGGWLAGS